MAVRQQFCKPFGGTALQIQGRSTRWRIDHADVAHEYAAAKSGAHRLAERLFGGEAFRVGSRDGEGPTTGLGALDFGENAVFEALAKSFERVGDPLNIAQVRSQADDHCFGPAVSIPLPPGTIDGGEFFLRDVTGDDRA